MKRDHLVIYDNTNSYTFWLGDIRGVETKERFETTQDLIDYLTTCFKTIKTTEVIWKKKPLNKDFTPTQSRKMTHLTATCHEQVRKALLLFVYFLQYFAYWLGVLLFTLVFHPINNNERKPIWIKI